MKPGSEHKYERRSETVSSELRLAGPPRYRLDGGRGPTTIAIPFVRQGLSAPALPRGRPLDPSGRGVLKGLEGTFG